MTREEAWNEIDAIIGKHEIDDEYVTITREQGYEALRVAREALEQQTEDAISRQAVLGILKDKWNMFSDANDAMQESIDTIEAFPLVTPQPKTGHWYRKHSWEICFTCSECGTTNASGTKYNYCPSCGCRMEEREG